jgi:hypothetical protein
MKQIAVPQTNSAVSHPALVNQERKRNVCFFLEKLGVTLAAHAYRGYTCSLVLKRLFMLAQLRHMLTAENSPIVPEEHKDAGLSLPKGTKPDFASITIWQHDSGQRRTERLSHTRYLRFC